MSLVRLPAGLGARFYDGWVEGMTTGPAFRNEYEQELLAALETFIDHVEEINLMLAEVLLRTNSGDLRVLAEDFDAETPITYQKALQVYEKFCREARLKWNLPSKEA